MPTPKLNQETITRIRDLLAKGKKQKEIAAELKCAQGTVAKVKAGGFDNDGRPDPTDARINQLEGLLHQRDDEINYLKKKVKTAQRDAVDFDAIIEAIQGMVTPLTPPARLNPDYSKEVEEDVALVLSDGHWDAMICKRNNNGLEEFNPDIAIARAEHLTSTLIEWCSVNLQAHCFNRLWLLCLGDFGNYRIHNAEKHSAHKNAIKSGLWAGQLISMMAWDLAQHFPRVECVFVSGNHGRQKEVSKKDYNEPTNSYDYLAAKTAEIYCTDCDRIGFIIPESFTTVVNIRGWNYHLSHGDDILSVMGIPYYGIDRKTLRLVRLHSVLNTKIDVNIMGHFHEGFYRPNTFPRMLVNGCFPATDPFAHNKCDGYVEPMQFAFGIHDHRPISWPLPIYLKGGGDKRQGRYDVDIV